MYPPIFDHIPLLSGTRDTLPAPRSHPQRTGRLLLLLPTFLPRRRRNANPTPWAFLKEVSLRDQTVHLQCPDLLDRNQILPCVRFAFPSTWSTTTGGTDVVLCFDMSVISQTFNEMSGLIDFRVKKCGLGHTATERENCALSFHYAYSSHELPEWSLPFLNLLTSRR